LESALRATVIGYESCIPIAKNIQLNRGKVYYALLPVWLLTTKWEGKDYLFAINGQTGRLAGDLPCSMTKYWRLFAVIAGVLSVLGTAVLALL
jgi:hypothetical protein